MKLSGLHHIPRVWQCMEDDLQNDHRARNFQDAEYVRLSKKKV